MICGVPGCYHKVKTASSTSRSDSWDRFGVCPCCCQELIIMGCITQVTHLPTNPCANQDPDVWTGWYAVFVTSGIRQGDYVHYFYKGRCLCGSVSDAGHDVLLKPWKSQTRLCGLCKNRKAQYNDLENMPTP